MFTSPTLCSNTVPTLITKCAPTVYEVWGALTINDTFGSKFQTIFKNNVQLPLKKSLVLGFFCVDVFEGGYSSIDTLGNSTACHESGNFKH